MKPAERMRAWRERMREDGARQVNLMLPADAWAALESIKARSRGLTTAEIVARALIALDKKRRV